MLVATLIEVATVAKLGHFVQQDAPDAFLAAALNLRRLIETQRSPDPHREEQLGKT